MKWGGKEVESSLHRATGAIIRCNSGKILTKSEVQYIRVSGNIALMLPILKRERTYFQTYATRAQARVDLIDYIEEFYNEARLHSYLDYVSPNEFECVRES